MSATDSTPTAEMIERTGYLIMVSRYVGSKSERLCPCLLGSDAQTIWLKHAKDNSFSHATLKPFHLRLVKVSGLMRRDGQLLVRDITPSDETPKTA